MALLPPSPFPNRRHGTCGFYVLQEVGLYASSKEGPSIQLHNGLAQMLAQLRPPQIFYPVYQRGPLGRRTGCQRSLPPRGPCVLGSRLHGLSLNPFTISILMIDDLIILFISFLLTSVHLLVAVHVRYLSVRRD